MNLEQRSITTIKEWCKELNFKKNPDLTGIDAQKCFNGRNIEILVEQGQAINEDQIRTYNQYKLHLQLVAKNV